MKKQERCFPSGGGSLELERKSRQPQLFTWTMAQAPGNQEARCEGSGEPQAEEQLCEPVVLPGMVGPGPEPGGGLPATLSQEQQCLECYSSSC